MTQAFNLGSAANNFSSSGVSGLIYELNSDLVGANSTATQSAFGVGVSLTDSTVYQFEAQYILSKTAGTTSHNMSFLFGGTATLNNITYSSTRNLTNTSFITGGAVSGVLFQTASASIVQTAQTNAAVYLYFVLRGIVSVNTGGTFIPQYVLSAAPGGAYTMAQGSYFTLRPIGAAGSNINVGGWA